MSKLNKLKVQNAIGTSPLSPRGFSSWLEYWENFKGQLSAKYYYCPACGNLTHKSKFVGAHVTIGGLPFGQMYIVPLCNSCNHRTGVFSVNADLLVPSNL
ncbi:hypothetical protein [uncultured Rikenella sp.]|uniref:hypothetical protein n=1 Tax=uncultured Rikenella sp. TaxID=368003 RepID=UPI0025E994BC|nr:hypothetical protein [uncultured Rikenella sp.]